MKPENFPIGSLESRAAVRNILSRRNARRKRLRIISNIPSGGQDNSRIRFGGWQEWGEDTLAQLIYVPHVWVKPGEAIPVCPDCATPFKKTNEYPDLAGYSVGCLHKHDPDRFPSASSVCPEKCGVA
jgi:hypothetical protein